MNINWKGALLGSALAVAVHTWADAKNFTCPTNSPVVDNIGLLKAWTKKKIEDRIRNIDTEMHHQVVVMTVDNLEEYWYWSIAEMANAIWTNCKVGYRWENTWVVVLYTKSPSRYRIETASSERYITDAESWRILAKSKSDWICKKEDVDCRLDYITGEIDKLVRKEFNTPWSVDNLKQSTQKFDDIKNSQELSKLMWNVWMGAVIFIVLWGVWLGWYKWINAIKRNNRRKEIKRELLELNTLFQTEKQKFPDWFINEFVAKKELELLEMINYSDEKLNNIVTSERRKNIFDNNILLIKEEIWSWQEKYDKILKQKTDKMNEYNDNLKELIKLKQSLEKNNFRFWEIKIPEIKEWENPSQTVCNIANANWTLKKSLDFLKDIPEFYKSLSWLEKDLVNKLLKLKDEFVLISKEHKEIYWKSTDFDITWLESKVADFNIDFNKAYIEKDITNLKGLFRYNKSIFSELEKTIKQMEESVYEYNVIPSLLIYKKNELEWIKYNDEYPKNAAKYIKKTGKKNFANYDMWLVLWALAWMLALVSSNHANKKDLNLIKWKLAEFDKELNKLKEYMWLGEVLEEIIADEIAEALRKKEAAEKQRLKKIEEEKEAERRRKKREEEEREEEESNKNNYSIKDSSGDNWWTPGWGGWFGWGWADDD